MRLISLVVLMAAAACHHTSAIRRALAERGTPCEEVTYKGDPSHGDGWLQRAEGCGRGWWCWVGKTTGKMMCSEHRPNEIRDALAREALHCPDGKLDGAEVAGWEGKISGCDRATWCDEAHVDVVKCFHPEDLFLATKQLSVETGCAPETIEQLQAVEMSGQSTYRLRACGAVYSCTVPMFLDRRVGRTRPSPEGQLTCKTVPATAAQ